MVACRLLWQLCFTQIIQQLSLSCDCCSPTSRHRVIAPSILHVDFRRTPIVITYNFSRTPKYTALRKAKHYYTVREPSIITVIYTVL